MGNGNAQMVNGLFDRHGKARAVRHAVFQRGDTESVATSAEVHLYPTPHSYF